MSIVDLKLMPNDVDRKKPPLNTNLSAYLEAARRFKNASKKNDFNNILGELQFW